MSETVVFFAALTVISIFIFLLASLLSAINDSKHSERDWETENESDSSKGKGYNAKHHPLVFVIENAIKSYSRERQSEDRKKSRRDKYSLVLATFTSAFALSA